MLSTSLLLLCLEDLSLGNGLSMSTLGFLHELFSNSDVMGGLLEVRFHFLNSLFNLFVKLLGHDLVVLSNFMVNLRCVSVFLRHVFVVHSFRVEVSSSDFVLSDRVLRSADRVLEHSDSVSVISKSYSVTHIVLNMLMGKSVMLDHQLSVLVIGDLHLFEGRE